MDTPRPGDKGYLLDRIAQAHDGAVLDEVEMIWNLPTTPIDEKREAS
jgi:hypothetical protein